MALWDSFGDLRRMQRDMNTLFDSGFQISPAPELKNWHPSVDVKETDTELIIHAELPGVKKEDIKVDLKDGVLTLSGERKYEKKVDKETYHRVERSYGKFSRSFYLGKDVTSESIKANLKDGVLEVSTAKPSAPKATAASITVH